MSFVAFRAHLSLGVADGVVEGGRADPLASGSYAAASRRKGAVFAGLGGDVNGRLTSDPLDADVLLRSPVATSIV